VLLAFQMRTHAQPVLLKGLCTNAGMLLWAVATAVTCLIVGGVDPVAEAIGFHPLTTREWGVVTVIALGTTGWIEVVKLMRWVVLGATHAARATKTTDEPSKPLLRSVGV
jgi:hypothetical protein